MYMFMIDYGYNLIIILTFLTIPIYILFKAKSINLKSIVFYNLKGFILFVVISIICFILKTHHISYIEHICFDYPVMVYKKHIPQECYHFNPANYQGVGWPISLFFWIIIYWLYSFTLFSLKLMYDKKKDS